MVSEQQEALIESCEISLVNKPSCKSTIWRYFGFIPDVNGKPEHATRLLM